MKKLINLNHWEFNYLDIVDPNEFGQYYYYFKNLVHQASKLSTGDIVEAGVFRGKSLITAGLILKKINKNQTVWGYDTFSGFKGKEHKKDQFKNFYKLYKKGKIKKNHYNQILKLKKHHNFIKHKKKPSIFNLSTSNNFSSTSLNFVKKKINYFECTKKIKLVSGDFKKSFLNDKNIPKKIITGIIDCDLYEGYISSLNTFFPNLIVNGKLFLDEYYSLKFPGPRIAVNEFLIKNKNAKLIKEGITNGFERWSIQRK